MKKIQDISEIATKKIVAVPSHRPGMPRSKSVSFITVVNLALLLLSVVLWLCSLQHESVYAMNDLGLVSTLPPSFMIAVAALCTSFCLNLRNSKLNVPLLMFHLFLLIFMLYGIQNIVEEAPRFNIVYRHAGYTEYIMRTGTVNTDLDAYFSWPGFFVLSAVVTKLAGYNSALSFAGWAPVFYNMIYASPLYLLFTSATTNRRLVWLSLWFFFLTNWVGQDYFSPQGLAFFFYLVILAILVKWFKSSPSKVALNTQTFVLRFINSLLRAPSGVPTKEELQQGKVMIVIILVLFLFVVYSHPLTPFALLISVGGLVFLRRCRAFWLLVVMTFIVAFWDLVMAHTFLVGHMSMVTGSFGQLTGTVSSGLTQRASSGDAEHIFVADMRIAMSVLLWVFAFLEIFRRFQKGQRDTTYTLLALVTFSLVVANQYGGEMFLRVYLFSLPFMVFFAASFFLPMYRLSMYKTSSLRIVAIIFATFVLFSGFLFTKYGNERADYMTYKEVEGIQYLYKIAPAGSLFVAIYSTPPWQFQDYEQYRCKYIDPGTSTADGIKNVEQVVTSNQDVSHIYLVFTRSEEASVEEDVGLPPGTLNRLRLALLQSGAFKTIYSNRDAQILVFVGNTRR
jgi:hypothetical protein